MAETKLNLYRVSYFYRSGPVDFKTDYKPSPVQKIANVVAETEVAAGNFITATKGNEVVTVTLSTHDVTVAGATGVKPYTAPTAAAQTASAADLKAKGFTDEQISAMKAR